MNTRFDLVKSGLRMNMNDISAIRVLNFTGKKEEWSTLSETFLAKARRSRFIEILIGRYLIPKSNDEISEEKDQRRQ
jgi:hypothetical protein